MTVVSASGNGFSWMSPCYRFSYLPGLRLPWSPGVAPLASGAALPRASCRSGIGKRDVVGSFRFAESRDALDRVAMLFDGMRRAQIFKKNHFKISIMAVSDGGLYDGLRRNARAIDTQ